ncbi:hypothetical protein GCM10022247_70940 [Allokutzneria multivorans]|uniref:Knr4/Smi1-like domain-containing protein n=1 Tax=Allokutzneria multivorans TaxID=1142134 RepID=A0ABP7U3A2_9PSEU
MENAVDRLADIIAPPAPAGTEVNWEETVRRLRTALPTDYVQLIERYGGGQFDGYLWLLEPGSSSDYDLAEITEEREEALEYLWNEGEAKPAVLDAPGVRAIAWGSTDNGEYLYWLARPGDDPDAWTVLVNEARGERWEHFAMGCAEFLVTTLTGEVRSDLLWSLYPASPHEFFPSALIDHED